MPRQARIDTPGALHHVMIRGIERRKIFLNDSDREDLLTRLSKLFSETGISCFAWALMPNHAHFLLRTGIIPLASLMRRLLTGYAVTFNRRHQRYGHLFQNRYKSIICEEDLYLKELVRYIHLNPVRAGIVEDIRQLNTYPYCGHSALIGNIQRPWQDVGYILDYFDTKVDRARMAYVQYMIEGFAQGRREDLIGGGLIRSISGWTEAKKLKKRENLVSDERILGGSFFVESILSAANENYERHYKLKALGYDLNSIAKRVGKLCKMDPSDFLSQGRQKPKVKARSLYCYWAVRELGVSLRELSRQLSISPPAVSYCVEKGRKIASENELKLLE